MILRVSGQFTQLLDLWLRHNHLLTAVLQQRLEQMAQRDTVPVEIWREVLNEVSLIAPQRHFGLDVGAQVTLKHVGVLGFLVSSCESLANGLEVYQLCERRFYGRNFASLQQTEDFYQLSWKDQLGDNNGLFVQVALSALVSFLRLRFPSTFRLHSVALTESTPQDTRPYTQFFDCPVTFNSKQPGISVNRHAAYQAENAKLPSAFRAMRNQQSEAFSSATGVDSPLMQQLQPALLKRLPRGQISLTDVAEDLQMSPRTLQRRLGEYGFSYQSMLDAVREQLACRYLQQNNLTYLEMAYLLGFSEQSAFNRAFKKWTGMPPGQYRPTVIHQ